MDVGRLEGEVAQLRAQLAEDPSCARRRNLLAVALVDLGTHLRLGGDEEAGVARYRESLRYNPSYCASHYNLGVAAEAKRADEAIEHYETALLCNPACIEALTNLGVVKRRLGLLDEACTYFEKALKVRPNMPIICTNYAVTLSDLGTKKQTAGDHKAAIKLYKQAVLIHPYYPDGYYNLGVAYGSVGNLAKSCYYYELAVHFKPDYAEAWNNLGVVFKQVGTADRAIECFERALALNGTFAQTMNNLAVLLSLHGQMNRAQGLLRQAVALRPLYAEAHNNLGVILRDEGVLHEALQCYERCLAICPAAENAAQNRLLALNFSLEHTPESIQRAHLDWGNRILRTHVLPRLAAKPGEPAVPASNLEAPVPEAQLAALLGSLADRFEKTPLKEKRVLRVGYVSPDFYLHSVSYFIHNPLKHHGRVGTGSRRQAGAADAGPAQGNGSQPTRGGEAPALPSNAPDPHPAANGKAQPQKPSPKRQARGGGGVVAAEEDVAANGGGDPLKKKRLKSGAGAGAGARGFSRFLAADGVAEEDLPEIEVYCFANVAKPDSKTFAFQQLVPPERWVNIFGMGMDEAADTIRRKQIDVLVDLTGHTGSNRLDIFARKPAPIQVTWIGYPNTTGLRTIDYRFTDDSVDPRSDTNPDDYAETLYRLPGSFLCYCADTPAAGSSDDPGEKTGDGGKPGAPPGNGDVAGLHTDVSMGPGEGASGRPAPPANGGGAAAAEIHAKILEGEEDFAVNHRGDIVPVIPKTTAYGSNGYPTFGTFNNMAKINSAVVSVWGRIMQRIPTCRFFLKSKPFAEKRVRDQFLKQFEDAFPGIDTSRITLMGIIPQHYNHLQAYERVDVALDVWPYAGTTTSCEALWMGVPMVTLKGKSHAWNVGASLLTSVGCPELIAATEEQYVDIAVALATDPARLEYYRQNLQRKMASSILCDGAQFTRNVETAYCEMWHAFTKGKKVEDPSPLSS
ncbi:putative UDP-N-acetylglucosamine--peptide N-acetylglucosaminyltransferase SPINDLY [Diplonema papillatum]|nr:putative UDP-N-acetylglucosamine--peptide N-acetylglucosaminyltransferase SPINDLY [Diplonema papillatum]